MAQSMARTITIFTQEILAKIPVWVEAGVSQEEIAERIGTTVGSLKTRCSQHRISLRSASKAINALFNGKSQLRLAVPVSQRALQKLADHAAIKGMGTDALAAVLLETIANDGLYNAVLDDE